MERSIIEQRLAIAERHVAEGQRHVLEQCERVARMERAGRNCSESRRLLAQFEELQSMPIADRERIRNELEEARD